jgi:hypothetical protein
MSFLLLFFIDLAYLGSISSRKMHGGRGNAARAAAILRHCSAFPPAWMLA